MTRLFVRIYHYLRKHRAIMWCSMLLLFLFCGWYAAQIHLEEDLNKLMPSSKNEDGTTKLAFANLRIKDKTFLLFEGKEGTTPEDIILCCDEFVDSLIAQNEALDSNRVFSDIFYKLDDDLMPTAIDYLSQNIPAYIDASTYSCFDTLLTEEHMLRQMQQNARDFESEFGSMFPELIEMDPIGMRNVLAGSLAGIAGDKTGGITTVDNHFFVPDTTVCLAFISPQFSATNTGQGNRMFEIINEEIGDFSARYPNIHICYHGTPANGYYNSTTIKGDLVGTVAWSEVIVLLLLFLCMRNWNTIPLLFLPVAFGTLFGLAIMYFIKGQFSLMALGIGAIVLGVAMSYVLHILVHYKYVGNAEQVLRDETKPVLLGCVTTIGSFIGLLFVKTDLLQDFGLFAALAIIGTTVFSLIYLPHLMEMEKNKVNRKAFALIDKFNACRFHEKKWLLGIIAILTVICISAYLYKGTRFDSDMSNLGYVEKEVDYAAKLYQDKTATGYNSTFFASQGKTMEEALENFSLLEHKLDSLQRLGLVKKYTPINKFFIPLEVQQERIDTWNEYWNEERLGKVRTLIAKTAPKAGLNAEGFEPFFDMATADYEPEPLYEAGIIPAGYLSTMMEETWDGEYLCFTSVQYEGRSSVSENKDFLDICNTIAKEPNLLVMNTSYYTQDTLSALNSDFNVLQWMSMAFVFLVLHVSFHFRLRNTLLGFAPILLSWVVVLGAMAIFDMQFNLINIIISTFIFGIGVDYSIFVMNALITDKENAAGGSEMLRLHKTSIIFSAVILIVTVASMLFARHPAIQSVGFATLVGMVSAVVLSYVCQPAIFKWMNERKNTRK
ncbi:MAG: MMPL family transporter [Bacteroidaceae bacterium]|nr:MMPL family transporter [Bacteroidaceae bacterium]